MSRHASPSGRRAHRRGMSPPSGDDRDYPDSGGPRSPPRRRKGEGPAMDLASELAKYAHHVNALRRVLQETFTQFQEMNSSRFIEEEGMTEMRLLEDEEDLVSSVLDKQPALVVLGQTPQAKAFIVNQLFGEEVIPIQEYLEHQTTWRLVRFRYGNRAVLSVSLPNSFEMVNTIMSNSPRAWKTIPKDDLELKGEDCMDAALTKASLEVSLNHALLRNRCLVVMSPCNDVHSSTVEVFKRCIEDVVPVLIYGVSEEELSPRDLLDLQELRAASPDLPIFFIRTRSVDLTESERHRSNDERHRGNEDHEAAGHPTELSYQLVDMGYIPERRLHQSTTHKDAVNEHQRRLRSGTVYADVGSEIHESFSEIGKLMVFARRVLFSHLVRVATVLNEAHSRCLRMVIFTAFDMARDMIITPRRIEYAREREAELYASLRAIADKKQLEIRELILETLRDTENELLNEAEVYEFHSVFVNSNGKLSSMREAKKASLEIQELVLSRLNSHIADQLIGSVEYMKESWVGTLSRCLSSLEQGGGDRVSGVDDRMMGMSPTVALKKIVNAAYRVEVTPYTSSSFIRVLLEKLRSLFRGMPGQTPPTIDRAWKRKIALDMVRGLSECKLAQNICEQFKVKLCQSHEAFLASLRQLEHRHRGRLERTEDSRLKVRKYHAPQIAKLALESTALKDMIQYGMPQLGREIGRGQYGVVYACEAWAGYSPCAVKSVVPPDDKHWNDLALEFHYTKNIPEHPRIACLRGSVIDFGYGNGGSPAVLLVMDRMQRDLYSAIKAGITLTTRLHVALDVVEGIRYLHSQGLVHRDIKLKNVLMDRQNRGKITDLGFCKPEAMMSGSIVGTPIHMAPELFSGNYDNSVDVYAFGILFWYICAGHVKLPRAFEQCGTKDQLWNHVKRGTRPERLSQFDDAMWDVMERCWCSDYGRRPLLGIVQKDLESMLDSYSRHSVRNSTFYAPSPTN